MKEISVRVVQNLRHCKFCVHGIRMSLFLQIPTIFLFFMGYTFNKKEHFALRCYAFFNTILLTVIFIPEITFDMHNTSNIRVVSDALCPHLTCLLSVVKALTLFFNRDKFYDLVADLKDMIRKGIFYIYQILLPRQGSFANNTIVPKYPIYIVEK